ncbi:zinc finger and SCAN domain-containing protein 30 [Alligator mississippiensis]|nr:zinc finger and SCAN domain-containing protein 30 [Alligator mississippiensis]
MAAELGAAPGLAFPFEALLQPLVKKEEQDPAGPKPRDKARGCVPARPGKEPLRVVVKQEPQEEAVQRWEVLQSPLFPAEALPAPVTPRQLELAPQDDPPALEMRRQRFRGFCYQEAAGPREVCSRLRELCRSWLEPQRRSKEQMLELVVLEQFLAILPQEMQSWEWGRGVETCAQAVALAEGFQLGQAEDAKLQVTVRVKVEDVASDKMEPTGALWEPLDSSLERPQLHPVELAGWAESPGPQNELPHGSRKELPQLLGSGAGILGKAEEQLPKEGPTNLEGLRTSPGRPLRPEQGRLCKRKGRPQKHKQHVEMLAPLGLESGSGVDLPDGWGCGETTEDLGDLTSIQSWFPQYEGQPPIQVGMDGLQGKQELSAKRRERAHPCPQCGKSFLSRADMARHQHIHSGEKPHGCPDCGKGFSSRSDMARHRRIHSGEKPHSCPECGKSFLWRWKLIRHQHVHSGEKLHHCECGKSFSRLDHLAAHRRIHSGERPHRCSDCGKSFAQSSGLAVHRKFHLGEKPHGCPDCGKSFVNRSDLAHHRRVHSSERPCSCPDCGKSFPDRSSLARHRHVHAQEGP